jgi:hypothetical protein
MFLDKDRRMDNVHKNDICTDVPSSGTFRSHSQRTCSDRSGGSKNSWSKTSVSGKRKLDVLA